MIIVLLVLLFGQVNTVPGKVLYDRLFNTSTISTKVNPTIATEVGSNRSWVQTFTQASWISSDGKIFSYSNWDEAKRTVGVYKNNSVIGTLSPATQSVVLNWGDITGDNNYVYLTSRIDYGNWTTGGYGVLRANAKTFSWAGWTGGAGKNSSYFKIRDTSVVSLYRNITVDSTTKKLFVTDSFNNINKVFVFNLNPISTTPVDSFELSGIKDMWADKGMLWIIIGDEIRQYSQKGVYQNKKMISENPTKIVINRQNQMMVWDNDLNIVKFYTNFATFPRLIKTFGTPGGYYGLTSVPKSYFKVLPPGLRGMGTDVNGNLYLTWGYGYPHFTDIRVYNKNGDSLYHQYNASFVCVGGFDYRKDGNEVFTTNYKFSIDWSLPIDKKERFISYTADYKGQMSPMGGRTEVRYVGNKRLLIKDNSDLYGNGFTIFYEDGNFFRRAKSFGWGESKAFYMDTLGNVWDGNGSTIKEYKYVGLINGVPMWDTINFRIYQKERDFLKYSRIFYEPATDELFATGYDLRFPSSSGKGIGRVIKKYSDFKKPTRRLAWSDTLAMDALWMDFEKAAITISGDYIFIISIGDEPRTLDVYKTSNFEHVGKIFPGSDIQGDVCPNGSCGMIGWIDTPFGMTSMKRKNGEYLILIENDLTGNNILYRWCPTGNCPNR